MTLRSGRSELSIRWRQQAQACNLSIGISNIPLIGALFRREFAGLGLDRFIRRRLRRSDAVVAAKTWRADLTQHLLFRRVSTE